MIKQTFSWDEIPDGDSFRKLAQAILNHRNPEQMMSPDAPGKDFGIDDKWTPPGRRKATVYSFKRVALKAILFAAVKRDADRLRNRMASPSAKFARLWSDVGSYEVWTNQPLSPQDQAEVAKFFAGLPFKVTSRGGKYVEDSAAKHPIVMHTFFGSKQVLLEPIEAFVARSALSPELRRHYDVGSPFVERDGALAEIGDALRSGSATLVAVTGPGGTGKTRLLIEACRKTGERCLFLNPDVRDLAGHFDELAAARGSVIVVDEAQDALASLGTLLDFCDRDPRLKGQFRFIVAARPTVWPQVEELVNAKVAGGGIRRVSLGLVTDVLPILRHWGYADAESRQLARLAGGNPMWLTFAHEAVQAGADVASLTRSGVAGAYVRNRLGEVKIQDVEGLLGTMAALSPLNVESDSDLEMVSRRTGLGRNGLLKAVDELVTAGIVQRGGRLHRVRPDILADRFLRDLLFDSSNRPSGVSADLIESATEGTIVRILQNLAKAEATSGGDLLAPVVKDALAGMPNWDNGGRLGALSALKALAYVRPADAVRIGGVVFDLPREADTVEYVGFFDLKQQTEVRQERVVGAAIDFVAPALKSPDTFLDAVRLIERTITEYPESGAAKAARTKLSEATSWKERYNAGWMEAVLEWSARRIRTSLAGGRDSVDGTLLDLASVPVRSVLGLRYSETRYENRAFSISQGQISLTPAIRALRARAVAHLRTLLASDSPRAVALRTEIAREAIIQWLVEIPRYKPEARRYLLADIEGLEPAVLKAATGKATLPALISLDGLARWVAEAPLGKSAKAFGSALRRALASDAGNEMALRIFGQRSWKRRGTFPFADVGRDALRHFGPDLLVPSLAGMIREAAGDAGAAFEILVALAAAEPEEARKILLSGLGASTIAGEEEGLLACVFAGLRIATGDGICADALVRESPRVVAQGYARIRYERVAGGFTERDRELLALACDGANPATCVQAAAGMDADAGAFLTAVSRKALDRDPTSAELGSMLSVWNGYCREGNPLPEKFGLPELLLSVADRADLVGSGQAWYLEELIAWAANAEDGFLDAFLGKRLRALSASSELSDAWFFEAHHFSELLALEQEKVARVVKSVLDVASETGISSFYLNGLYRDLFRRDVRVAKKALAAWSAERPDGERLVQASELLREFAFTEDKLEGVEALLELSLDLPKEQRDRVESALGAAMGDYEINGGDTSALERRIELALSFAESRASALNRPFYRRLAKGIQQDIDSHRRMDAERDLE